MFIPVPQRINNKLSEGLLSITERRVDSTAKSQANQQCSLYSFSPQTTRIHFAIALLK